MMGELFFLPGGKVVVLAYLFFWLMPQGPGANQANFDKIRVGMSKAEVEKLLGGPPSRYVPETVMHSVVKAGGKEGVTLGKDVVAVEMEIGMLPCRPPTDPDHYPPAIEVRFDSKGVNEKNFPPDETPWFLAKLRCWLNME